MSHAVPNEGKALEVEIDGQRFQRVPLRTRVVMPGDNITEIITTYAAEAVRPGDTLFVTEKIVAIMQGRSYALDDIKVRPLARFLSKFVVRTPYGIGLGMVLAGQAQTILQVYAAYSIGIGAGVGALAGAAIGCAVGHHRAKVAARKQAAQAQPHRG